MQRRIVSRAWNVQHASGTINGYRRVITPFRAVTNTGDFLARQNYTCGGPNVSHTNSTSRFFDRARSNCDGTGVPGSSCNPKFVADSSDYARYRRERAVNLTYTEP